MHRADVLKRVVDAEYVLIPPRLGFRLSFWACFWWAVYVAGFALAARDATDKGEVIVYVIGASLIVPAGRLVSASWEALTGPLTTEQEALQLRQRLLRQGETTIWSAWRRRAAGRKSVVIRP